MEFIIIQMYIYIFITAFSKGYPKCNSELCNTHILTRPVAALGNQNGIQIKCIEIRCFETIGVK